MLLWNSIKSTIFFTLQLSEISGIPLENIEFAKVSKILSIFNFNGMDVWLWVILFTKWLLLLRVEERFHVTFLY